MFTNWVKLHQKKINKKTSLSWASLRLLKKLLGKNNLVQGQQENFRNLGQESDRVNLITDYSELT
jgi:hypothetical protein